ncbi:MAG: TauD/TfdA family dioxygenase [Pseudomonadota bacterium]
MSYQHISVNPVPGALGAEVSNVNPEVLSPETVSEIRQAFLQHHVLFFRELSLTPESQTAFGQQFGVLDDYPFVAPIEGFPKIIPVIKEADEKANFGGGWHTDLIYTFKPPAATMLYALEVPQRGGDTLFADGVLAFNALSQRMQALCESLSVRYSVKHVARAIVERTDGQKTGNRSMLSTQNETVLNAEPVHPLVRTHPESNEKCLYFSRGHTIQFEGMTPPESAPLLDWLQQHMTRIEFTTRFHWQPGSMAFWDNRCVSHYALNDYHGERRAMHRLTIAGNKPY